MSNSENNTGNKILEAASKLIIEKGVQKTSLSDIAKEVGISKGTLYYYYSSKDDLIEDIANNYFNEMTKSILESINSIKKYELDFNMLLGIITNILKDKTTGRLHICLIEEALTRNDTLKKRFKEKYAQWKIVVKEQLEKMIKKENIDYDALGSIVVAIIDGFILESILEVEIHDAQDISKYIISKV